METRIRNAFRLRLNLKKLASDKYYNYNKRKVSQQFYCCAAHHHALYNDFL